MSKIVDLLEERIYLAVLVYILPVNIIVYSLLNLTWPPTLYAHYTCRMVTLKVIYHPLYSMNKFVTNKSKLPQDGTQVFLYVGWLAIMWPSVRVT